MNTVERQPMYGWNTISWKKVERGVFKLQKRIYRAQCRGNVRRVRSLQRLLMKSRSARLLAVRRVTQDNQGKKTAGVDGRKSLTPDQRWALVNTLSLSHETQPVRRVWIPKPATDEKRPLGIPTIFDRALQALVNMALEPQWEARFEPNSYGFRPGRSAWDAIGAIYVGINQKPKWVLDADIAKCFDRIDHEALLRKIHTKPTIRRQIKAWLKAGVVDNGELFPTEAGTPQGGTLTPPTKLQTFFFGTGLSRIWIDAKNDIDAVRGHFHPLDQGPNHLALAEPVRVLQPRVELGCKVLQASNNQTDFRLKGRHIKELLALLLQLRETLAQAGNAGFELVLFQQPLGVAVNQPREPLAHLPELRLKRGLDLVRPSGRGL
jgi:N-terminal domain of reverse transcriptase/Reverse transcriptase (RNA-dependent DNA polymerase)